jgi:hypothetical protein
MSACYVVEEDEAFFNFGECLEILIITSAIILQYLIALQSEQQSTSCNLTTSTIAVVDQAHVCTCFPRPVAVEKPCIGGAS